MHSHTNMENRGQHTVIKQQHHQTYNAVKMHVKSLFSENVVFEICRKCWQCVGAYFWYFYSSLILHIRCLKTGVQSLIFILTAMKFFPLLFPVAFFQRWCLWGLSFFPTRASSFSRVFFFFFFAVVKILQIPQYQWIRRTWLSTVKAEQCDKIILDLIQSGPQSERPIINSLCGQNVLYSCLVLNGSTFYSF